MARGPNQPTAVNLDARRVLQRADDGDSIREPVAIEPAGHVDEASMGKLMALALVCTMAAAVLFQPALMGPPRVERARRSKGRHRRNPTKRTNLALKPAPPADDAVDVHPT